MRGAHAQSSGGPSQCHKWRLAAALSKAVALAQPVVCRRMCRARVGQGHQHLASRGGRHSKDTPPPPRGVNFLLGGSDPPPRGVNFLLGGPDPLSKRFLGDFQRFLGDFRPIFSDF